MVSDKDFLHLPKLIPRYVLNLELYHMLNIAVEYE